MKTVKEIKERIATLSLKEKIFEDIELTYEQQMYERGKPKKYLEMTIELFNAIGGKSIVEIGCMRTMLTHPISEMHHECCNDGHSTYFWCTTGANLISVDIDRKAVSRARKSCKRFKNCKFLCNDGIKFLEKFKDKIDLLFLDAWDVIPNTSYAENHLLAYLKAKDKLNRANIISIDDTEIGGGGRDACYFLS